MIVDYRGNRKYTPEESARILIDDSFEVLIEDFDDYLGGFLDYSKLTDKDRAMIDGHMQRLISQIRDQIIGDVKEIM